MTGQGMSVKQAAVFLGLTEKCLRRRIDRGPVPHRKLGRSIMLWRSELEEWRQELPGCDPAQALQNLRNRNGEHSD